MFSRVVTILLLSLISIVSYAQNKTYLGIEASVAPDLCFSAIGHRIIHISKSGITAGGYSGFIIGANVRRELNRKLFIETGVLFTQYNSCFLIRNYVSIGSSTVNGWAVPFRFGGRINLAHNKIFLSPVVGYLFCFNPQHSSDFTQDFETHKYGSDTYNIVDLTHVSSSRVYSLFQSGLSMDFQVFRSAMLCVSANYYANFNRILKDDITYSVNSSAPQTDYGVGKGRMLTLGIGLKYAIHVGN